MHTAYNFASRNIPPFVRFSLFPPLVSGIQTGSDIKVFFFLFGATPTIFGWPICFSTLYPSASSPPVFLSSLFFPLQASLLTHRLHSLFSRYLKLAFVVTRSWALSNFVPSFTQDQQLLLVSIVERHISPTMSSSAVSAKASAFPDGTTDYKPMRANKKSDANKVHIADTPITWSNLHKHINWLNTTFIIIVPLMGMISSYWVPLQLYTAIFAFIYYFNTGLGITAGTLRLCFDYICFRYHSSN